MLFRSASGRAGGGNGGAIGGVDGGGATAQALNSSSMSSGPLRDNRGMGLILLEALGAGLVLIVIVWWTMFSGRKGGERPPDDEPPGA